jgi:hypothetical protein
MRQHDAVMSTATRTASLSPTLSPTTNSRSDFQVAIPDASAVQQYHADGYLRLGRIVDDATLQQLRAEEQRLRHPDHRGTVFRGQVSQMSAICRRLCIDGAHLPAIQALIGPDVLFFWNQFVTKLPRDPANTQVELSNGTFPWHQDCGYTDVAPTPITVWMALDDTTLDNGCIWVVPESHRQGLLDHRKVSAESWHITLDVATEGIPVLLKAGEAVAFSGYTLHRSLANRTAAARRAFFLEYAPGIAVETGLGSHATADRANAPLIDRPDTWMAAGQIPMGFHGAQGT